VFSTTCSQCDQPYAMQLIFWRSYSSVAISWHFVKASRQLEKTSTSSLMKPTRS